MKVYFKTLLLIIISFSLNAQCEIGPLEVENLGCNSEGIFSLSIDFEFANAGDDGFRIQGNGLNYGEFSYSDLPVILEGLQGDCSTIYEFVVRDIAVPACSNFIDYGVVCCEDNCSMKIVDFAVNECTFNEYSVTFDLVSNGTQQSGFDVFNNGEFVSFHSYEELPVTVTGFTSSLDQLQEIVVCENDNSTCCDTLLFFDNCSCYVGNFRYKTVDCNEADDEYYILLDLDAVQQADSFQVAGEINYGVFAYSDLPALIGPISYSPDGTDLLVADKGDFFCFTDLLLPPRQNCEVECSFGEVETYVSECREEGKFIHFTIDESNTNFSGFRAELSNGLVQEYQYGHPTYRIGPLEEPCDEMITLTLVDLEDQDCRILVELEENFCCQECSIRDIVLTAECNGDDLISEVVVTFNHNQSAADSFLLTFNGEISRHTYDDVPLTIPVAPANFVVANAIIVDLQDNNCRDNVTAEFECETQGECSIRDVFVEAYECNEGSFLLDIEFISENVGSSFQVTVNGQAIDTFTYGENFYTVGPLEDGCDGLEVVLTDTENEDCFGVFEIDEAVCCEDDLPCLVDQLTYELLCRDSGEKFITIDLDSDVMRPGGINFDPPIAGVNFIAYNDFPMTFEITDLEDGTFIITVNDSEDVDCSGTLPIQVDCEDGEDCSLSGLQVEYEGCLDNDLFFNYVISLDMINTMSDSFGLFIDGQLQGIFAYSDLPLATIDLEYRSNNYLITIIDRVTESCSISESFLASCPTSTTNNELDMVEMTYDQFNIRFDNVEGHYTSRVIDVLGRIKNTKSIDPSNRSFSLSNLSNGAYFVTLENQEVRRVYKILVLK